MDTKRPELSALHAEGIPVSSSAANLHFSFIASTSSLILVADVFLITSFAASHALCAMPFESYVPKANSNLLPGKLA